MDKRRLGVGSRGVLIGLRPFAESPKCTLTRLSSTGSYIKHDIVGTMTEAGGRNHLTEARRYFENNSFMNESMCSLVTQREVVIREVEAVPEKVAADEFVVVNGHDSDEEIVPVNSVGTTYDDNFGREDLENEEMEKK